MNGLSDYTSHAMQSEIDSIIDELDGLDDIIQRLSILRDNLPCSCGQDE
jgi:hypothetical protein